MQVNSLATATSLLRQAELIIEDEYCINLRGRSEFCGLCREQCHSQALNLTTDAVTVDTDVCTLCGGCVPVCPTGVLRLSGFSPRKLLTAITTLQQDDQPVHLHCSQSQNLQGGIVIPCFKLLDARLLAAIQAGGVCTVFIHGTASCVDCEHGDASQFLQQQQQLLSRWFAGAAIELQETGANDPLPVQTRVQQDQPELSRRNFLRFVSAGTANEISTWFFPVPDEAEIEADSIPFFQSDGLTHKPVLYQQLLAEQLPKLPWITDSVLPWHTRKISDACSGCMSCGERCPTGALNAVRESGVQQINFEAVLCTNCELCSHLCPERAFVVTPAQSVADVQRGRTTLVFHKVVNCELCRSPFIVESSLQTSCPVCRNEQDLDEEWLAMLEA